MEGHSKFCSKRRYNLFTIRFINFRIARTFLSLRPELFDVDKGNKDHIDNFIGNWSNYLERRRPRRFALLFKMILRYDRLGLVIEIQLSID